MLDLIQPSFLVLVMTATAISLASCGGSDGQAQSQSGGFAVANDGSAPVDVEAELEITYAGPPTPQTVAQADEIIEALRQKYNTSNVPAVLTPPYNADAVLDYAKTLKTFIAARPVDADWLRGLDAGTLSDADGFNNQATQNAANALLSRLDTYFPKELESTIKGTQANLVGTLNDQMNRVEEAAEADISDDRLLQNLFARPERVHAVQVAADDARTLIPIAAALEKELGGTAEDWDTKLAEVEGWHGQLAGKVHAAAKLIVPPADLGDADLLAAAKDVLSRERYEIGEWESLIVNAPVKRHRRALYTIDEYYITREQSVWEEFQATTIEKAEGGEFYLFYHDIVKYEMASPNVTAGKWILGKRFRGAAILEENIGG